MKNMIIAAILIIMSSSNVVHAAGKNQQPSLEKELAQIETCLQKTGFKKEKHYRVKKDMDESIAGVPLLKEYFFAFIGYVQRSPKALERVNTCMPKRIQIPLRS